MNNATKPLINLLKNLEIGVNPGNYRLIDYDSVGERMFNANNQNELHQYIRNVPRPNIHEEISISITGVEINNQNPSENQNNSSQPQSNK